MKRRNVDQKLQCFFKRGPLMHETPLVIVPHPVNVEAIRSHEVEPREGPVEFVPEAVGRVRSESLYETIAPGAPVAENIDPRS